MQSALARRIASTEMSERLKSWWCHWARTPRSHAAASQEASQTVDAAAAREASQTAAAAAAAGAVVLAATDADFLQIAATGAGFHQMIFRKGQGCSSMACICPCGLGQRCMLRES